MSQRSPISTPCMGGHLLKWLPGGAHVGIENVPGAVGATLPSQHKPGLVPYWTQCENSPWRQRWCVGQTQPREATLTSCFSSCSAWLRVMFFEYHLEQGHSHQGDLHSHLCPQPGLTLAQPGQAVQRAGQGWLLGLEAVRGCGRGRVTQPGWAHGLRRVTEQNGKRLQPSATRQVPLPSLTQRSPGNFWFQ